MGAWVPASRDSGTGESTVFRAAALETGLFPAGVSEHANTRHIRLEIKRARLNAWPT